MVRGESKNMWFWNKKYNRFKEDMYIRDFLMRTKFKGALTDQKLLKELRSAKYNGYSFTEVKEQILGFNVSNIQELACMICELTYKQDILDTYRPLKAEKKVKPVKKERT